MPQITLIPLIVILAFFCELIDSALGMGYGTTLTPILLLMGYPPAAIVPAVLLSEFVTGILAGVFHQEFGNVDFRRGSEDLRITAMLTLLSIVGVVVAVILAVNLPDWAIKVYIGALVLIIGVMLLVNRNRTFAFSWKRIGCLGLVAAFNKGISGGGYGPVVTGGQMLAGVDGKKAVGIASLAEGITSAVGITIYLISGSAFPWLLAPSLVLGAVASTPVAAYFVSKCPSRPLATAIGGLTTLLGGYMLVKLFL